ncbi:MAG: hypothetical protein AAB150_13895 [Pseudomonadota bacterium]
MRADSDLGELPVTVAIGALPAAAHASALVRACERANALQRRALIFAAYPALQGEVGALLPCVVLVAPAASRVAGQMP